MGNLKKFGFLAAMGVAMATLAACGDPGASSVTPSSSSASEISESGTIESHNSSEVAQYMEGLKATSEANHLYFHYLRYSNKVSSYAPWDVWVWPYRPNEGEGVRFDWKGRTTPADRVSAASGDAIIDSFGGAYIDIDLKATYKSGWDDATKKMLDLDASFDGETQIGVQVVKTSSRLSDSGFWKNDGGNNYLNLESFKMDLGDGKACYHAFYIQDGQYAISATPMIGASDPFDGDDGSNVTYGDDKYANVDFTSTKPVSDTASDFASGIGVGYQIMVSSFADSDGDGFGDIYGITQKLDYLEKLGVKALWLTPIQLSDSYHGYDISDYETVDPKYGSSVSPNAFAGFVTSSSALADYKDLIAAAHEKGMKVIMDLVLNHTSTNNVWFNKSANLDATYRGYYQWAYNGDSGEGGGGDSSSSSSSEDATGSYVVTGNPNWIANDNAAVFAWAWPSGENGAWYNVNIGTPGTGGADAKELTLSFDAPDNMVGVTFARCVAGTTTPDWNVSGDNAGRIYNQTEDITLDGPGTYSGASWKEYAGGKGRKAKATGYQIDAPLTYASKIDEDHCWYQYGDHWYSYYAKFGSAMPELNYSYKSTREAVEDMSVYWTKTVGVDGFRLDAVKHIYMLDEIGESATAGDTLIYDVADAGDYSSDLTKNLHFFKELKSYVTEQTGRDVFFVGENFDGHAFQVAPYYEGFDSMFDFYTYFKLTNTAASYLSTEQYHDGNKTASYMSQGGTFSDSSGIRQGNDKIFDGVLNTKKWTLPDVFSTYDLYRSKGRSSQKALPGVFTSNHDIARVINRICGTFDPAKWEIANQGKVTTGNYATLEKVAGVIKCVETLMPGLTWVYYGDELGMTGNFINGATKGTDSYADLGYRQPMKWKQGGVKGDGSMTCSYSINGASATVEWDEVNASSYVADAETQSKSASSSFGKLASAIAFKNAHPEMITGTMSDNASSEWVLSFKLSCSGSKSYIVTADFANAKVTVSGSASLTINL